MIVIKLNKKQLIVAWAIIVFPFLSNFAFAKESAKGNNETLYPVRWTSEVKIKDLNELDSLFNKPVDISRACEDCSLKLTDEKDENKKVKITTCKQYFDPKYKNFYAYSTYDITMESWFRLDCNTLKFLKNSIPSKVSYLSDFVLSKDAIRYLPAMLIYGFYGGTEEEFKRMNSKTLKDLEPKLKVKDKFNLGLDYDDTANTIKLLAWGDFNHDGIEDILLYITHHYVGGSGRSYESVVLTRLEKNKKLIELPLTINE